MAIQDRRYFTPWSSMAGDLQLKSVGKVSCIFMGSFTIPCLFIWNPHKRKGNFTPNDPSKRSPL